MANWWANTGYKVHLISFDNTTSPFYLSSKVNRIALNEIALKSDALCAEWAEEEYNINRLRVALLAAGESSVISFLSRMNMRTLLAGKGMQRKIIVSERVYPPGIDLGSKLERLREKLYKEAFALVVLNQYTCHNWAWEFMPSHKVEIIGNALWPDLPQHSNDIVIPDCPYILSVGRLVHQKGFDLLIRAFAQVQKHYPELKLLILGEGEELAALRRLARSLNLEHMVYMPGNSVNPKTIMKNASCYVLSSRFEGSPNALLEAMSIGAPCVAFDCPTGPAELIRHGDNGLLVENGNVTNLAQAILDLLGNSRLCQKLAAEAAKSTAIFTPDNIMAKWNKLLNHS
jgi:glycosyltransferase involved in cell wall biosynthesis